MTEPKECRIRCDAGPGMFTDEFVVRIRTLSPDGTIHLASSIVSGGSLKFDTRPKAGSYVEATLRAYCMDSRQNLVSVILPQTTLENGPSVVVPKTDVVSGWD